VSEVANQRIGNGRFDSFVCGSVFDGSSRCPLKKRSNGLRAVERPTLPTGVLVQLTGALSLARGVPVGVATLVVDA